MNWILFPLMGIFAYVFMAGIVYSFITGDRSKHNHKEIRRGNQYEGYYYVTECYDGCDKAGQIATFWLPILPFKLGQWTMEFKQRRDDRAEDKLKHNINMARLTKELERELGIE